MYDQFISNVAEDKKKKLGFVQSLNCLMQLRKICSHPDLIDDNFAESPFVVDPETWGLPEMFNLGHLFKGNTYSGFSHPSNISKN